MVWPIIFRNRFPTLPSDHKSPFQQESSLPKEAEPALQCFFGLAKKWCELFRLAFSTKTPFFSAKSCRKLPPVPPPPALDPLPAAPPPPPEAVRLPRQLVQLPHLARQLAVAGPRSPHPRHRHPVLNLWSRSHRFWPLPGQGPAEIDVPFWFPFGKHKKVVGGFPFTLFELTSIGGSNLQNQSKPPTNLAIHEWGPRFAF